jgi:hypothetical protein
MLYRYSEEVRGLTYNDLSSDGMHHLPEELGFEYLAGILLDTTQNKNAPFYLWA